MKGFESLADNADTKRRRLVERTDLAPSMSTHLGSGSAVGFLKMIYLDEQLASRRSDLLAQLLRTFWNTHMIDSTSQSIRQITIDSRASLLAFFHEIQNNPLTGNYLIVSPLKLGNLEKYATWAVVPDIFLLREGRGRHVHQEGKIGSIRRSVTRTPGSRHVPQPGRSLLKATIVPGWIYDQSSFTRLAERARRFPATTRLTRQRNIHRMTFCAPDDMLAFARQAGSLQ
jgi:hypothetical protein